MLASSLFSLHASLPQVVNAEEDFEWAFPPDEASDEPLIAEDETDGTYRPAYVYSYEHESYDFSYSFELEDLDSYSYEYVDPVSEEGSSYSHTYSYSFGYSYGLGEEAGRELPPASAVLSVTSMDVRVCTHGSVSFTSESQTAEAIFLRRQNTQF